MLSHRSPASSSYVPGPSAESDSAPEYGPNSDRIGLLDGELDTATPLLDEAGLAPDDGFEAEGRDRTGPETKDQALARHASNLRQIARVFEEGKRGYDPDPKSPVHLLKNAVEWLESDLVRLIVMSPTHDSHQRKSVGDGQRAFFDSRVSWGSSGADYQKGSDDGILVRDDGVVGGYRPSSDSLILFDPGRMSPSDIESLLVHEVQHDADQSATKPPVGDKEPEDCRWRETPTRSPDAVDPCTSEAWNVYQSEFRAYWCSPRTDNPNQFPEPREGSIPRPITAVYRRAGQPDVSRTVSTGFHNARQEAIFVHLWHPKADGVYKDVTREGGDPWVGTNAYLPHFYAFDPAFKQMVDGLSAPVGGNLVNSIRIEELATAIDVRDMERVRKAASELDKIDRVFLGDRTSSAPFWDQAHQMLSGADYAELEGLIDAPAR